MDLLHSILTTRRRKVVSRLSTKFVLPEDQIVFALDQLLGALKSGQHGRYIDRPSTLCSKPNSSKRTTDPKIGCVLSRLTPGSDRETRSESTTCN